MKLNGYQIVHEAYESEEPINDRNLPNPLEKKDKVKTWVYGTLLVGTLAAAALMIRKYRQAGKLTRSAAEKELKKLVIKDKVEKAIETAHAPQVHVPRPISNVPASTPIHPQTKKINDPTADAYNTMLNRGQVHAPVAPKEIKPKIEDVPVTAIKKDIIQNIPRVAKMEGVPFTKEFLDTHKGRGTFKGLQSLELAVNKGKDPDKVMKYLLAKYAGNVEWSTDKTDVLVQRALKLLKSNNYIPTVIDGKLGIVSPDKTFYFAK